MRVATMATALLLLCVLSLQSCAAVAGGAILSSDATAAAGGIGLMVTFLWLVGASLVLAKPRAAMWLFGASLPLCVLGGVLGFEELFYWSVPAGLFVLGSWLGIGERAKEAEQRAAAAAQAQLAPAGWHPDPWGTSRLRYYDGRAWTSHTAE